jgi:hypothetical protein
MKKLLYLQELKRLNQPRFFLFFIVVTAISLTVHGSLQLTAYEYPLKYYTKHINEEHFPYGRTLVRVMPLAKKD